MSSLPPLTTAPGGGYRLRPDGHPGIAPRGPVNPYPTPDDTAKKQSDQLANPPPVEIKTETNPYQKEAYGDAKRFADSISDRSHESITNAMQRTRDVGASAMADVAAQAGRRGGGPGSGLSGVLVQREGARNQAQVARTNADLTDVALGREQAARALEMGGATDIASEMGAGFRDQASLYLGRRRADLDQADHYAREQDRRFERTRRIAEMALDEGQDPDFIGGRPGDVPTGGLGGRRAPAPRTGTPSGGMGARTTGAQAARAIGGPAPATYSDIPGHPFAGGY